MGRSARHFRLVHSAPGREIHYRYGRQRGKLHPWLPAVVESLFHERSEHTRRPARGDRSRLCRMGFDPSTDITAVILTHYHHDHTGGLHHFPHTRIISPREGWNESRGLKGKMMGCLPQRWPIWFRPELV